MVSQQSSSNELYNLRWNSYFTNLINGFTAHQNQETLVDVTLSCEGQFIKAHRLVLSACSLYFQKMFETHTSPHLLVVLHDVRFKNLELVIQFMYKGEVKVADSEMQNFLALGKMLKVKGLCSVELEDKSKSESSNEKKTEEKLTQLSVSEKPIVDNGTKDSSETKKTVVNNKKKIDQTDQSKDTKEASTTSKKRKTSPVPSETATANKKKTPSKASPPSPESTDVSHIPRPPNAFMIFANQWRKKLAVEYPGDSNKDISVRLGNMWKSLSQETKDAFYEDARRADEEHKLKYPGPKEARNRKAIANITKTVLKTDPEDNGESSKDDEIVSFNVIS